MNLAVVLFLGGLVVILWIVAWNYLLSRQNQEEEHEQHPIGDMAKTLSHVPGAESDTDAILVSLEHGQLIYANGSARRWLGMNGGMPHLEQVAQQTEPSDNFLELFVGERQSSFQLGKRWVEGSSHTIPTGAEKRTVVVMRELSSATSHPDSLNLSETMNIINEIGETVNAGMGVSQVLQTLLSLISSAIKFDAGEICLWDNAQNALIQQGWVGDSMYLIALAEAGGRYLPGEGISGWIADNRKPVIVADRKDPLAIQPKLQDTHYQSFVAVPLTLGERFLGTLEFASSQSNFYTRGDLALLQAVSKPVAVAIYNAELYSEQMQRIDDIASIQQIHPSTRP